jgi:hypothetical protein
MITTRNPKRPCARIKMWWPGNESGTCRDSILVEATNWSDEAFDLLRLVALRCSRSGDKLTEEQREAIISAAATLRDAFMAEAMELDDASEAP